MLTAGLLFLGILASGFLFFTAGKNQGSQKLIEEVDEQYWIGKSAPELSEGSWINSEPKKLADLRGKVVLLEFWTFECYNCRNTLPAMNGWQTKYAGDDFVIIGVHTPEFDREKILANVRQSVQAQHIEYAVVTDNNYNTWNDYRQTYWPAIYLIDKKGIIRYVHFGEGNYNTTEEMIKKLLAEK